MRLRSLCGVSPSNVSIATCDKEGIFERILERDFFWSCASAFVGKMYKPLTSGSRSKATRTGIWYIKDLPLAVEVETMTCLFSHNWLIALAWWMYNSEIFRDSKRASDNSADRVFESFPAIQQMRQDHHTISCNLLWDCQMTAGNNLVSIVFCTFQFLYKLSNSMASSIWWRCLTWYERMVAQWRAQSGREENCRSLNESQPGIDPLHE